MQKILLQIRKECLNYSKSEKLFFVFAIICGFFITSEYAVTKPTSTSIFIEHYGMRLYPYAWLATLPLNLCVVTLYNRFLPYLGCFRMFVCTIFLTIGVNIAVAIWVTSCPFLSFFLYVWKDIYVLLMFQQLWSIIHIRTEMSKAKYLYGILFGFSGCGSICGSMIPSFFAVKVGSENLLFMTLPLYVCLMIFYYFMLGHYHYSNHKDLHITSHKMSQGRRLISSSTALKFVLLIVIFMQFATTIIQFQFDSVLHLKLPIQDVRTKFYGWLWAIINTWKLCFQFFATFLLVQFLGLRKSHFVIPGILLFNSILVLCYPGFFIITYSFVVIKSFDYSIFNIIKEMLYIPLKTDEKFKAKAIIDVFAYRSAKALASLFVIIMQIFCPFHLPYAFSWGPFAFFIIWIGVLIFFVKGVSFDTHVEQFAKTKC